MSLFRVIKYSSILFFLGKYKTKLFRVISVLVFALITSLLYQDVAAYLQLQHPETVIYALIGKIIIVYGSLAFVLWQFKPEADAAETALQSIEPDQHSEVTPDRLSRLGDVKAKDNLDSRYKKTLEDNKPR
ncbi:MAG: hypothetical protein V7696_02030 [Halioglobus sp.]